MSKDYPLVVRNSSSVDFLRRLQDADLRLKPGAQEFCGVSMFVHDDALGAAASSLMTAGSRYLEPHFTDPTVWLSTLAEPPQHAPTAFAHHGHFAGGGQLYSCVQDVHRSLKAINTLKDWQRHLRVESSVNFHKFDVDVLVHCVLFDLSKVDRFDTLPEMNVVNWPGLEFLPSTTSPATALDDRAVAILESRQQRDAILLSRDFRATLQTLVDEEQFSYYDLTQAIGVTRAMLSQWRDRPLEKVRQVSHAKMGRLLFAWKYWLHCTEGDMLGRHLRHVPDGSTASLLDLLASNEPTDEEIATLVDRLARHAATERKASARRRRDVGGLPQGSYRQDLMLD